MTSTDRGLLSRSARGLLILLLGILPTAGRARDLVDLPSFRAGCRALADERFSSASQFFRQAWEDLATTDSGGLERDFVTARLLESLVRNGDSEEAIDWIDTYPVSSPSPATLRWTALALHTGGRHAEAVENYARLDKALRKMPDDLVLSWAACLARTERPEEAYERVRDLPPPASHRGRVQLASILASAGRNEEALALIESEGEESGSAYLDRIALRLRVTILLRLQRGDEAVALLLDAVEKAEGPNALHTAFLLLEESRVSPDYPPLREALGSWAENTDHPASPYARFFSPLLLSPGEDSTEHLEQFPGHSGIASLAAEAEIRLRSLSGEEAAVQSDFAHLAGGEIRETFETASDEFRAGKFREAATRFSRLAGLQIGENRTRSLYNAALSHLEAGNRREFVETKESLREDNPRSPVVGDLELIEGLTLAAEADGRAATVLKQFSQEYPDHPFRIDALLALAEFHLNQAPARPQAASEIFESLRVRPLSLSQHERFDYSSIWLHRIEGHEAEFREASRRFLSDWPNSRYQAGVAMLLARALYEEGKTEEARELFHFVSSRSPSSPFAPIARFFEIKTTTDPVEAENGWRLLIAEDSQFADEARHELGMLHLSEKRYEEARAMFREVTDSVPADAPLRFAALGDIGFSYFREAIAAGGSAPLLEAASDAYARLVQQPGTPEEWIYNAAVRRGKCLEMLDRPNVALEIYESIVKRSKDPNPLTLRTASPEASTWVFRAGFAAIDILSRSRNWKAAIAIAEDLSNEDGPRAIEASRLGERMRLEHWIWD